MSLAPLILLIMFSALAWHDEPVRPPVIERRVNQQRLPHE
jgi:hypothetical protein